MKQIKNALCGLLLLAAIQTYALPSYSDNKAACVSGEANPVLRDTSLYAFVPVVLNSDQPVYGAADFQDRNPEPEKKRNRFKERQRVVIHISQTTGDIMLGIIEVAVEIAAQFCCNNL